MLIKSTMLIQLGTNRSGDAQGGPHLGGWSESWYRDGTVDDTRQKFLLLCTARARLLPTGAVIVGQRHALLTGGSSSAKVRFPGSAGVQNDIPQMGLLCTATGDGIVNVRRFTLRGFPDAWVLEGELKTSMPFANAFEQYRVRVTQDGWGFRHRDLTEDTARVFSISATGILTTFDALPNVVVGDFIQLRRVYDTSGRLRAGRYQVEATTDDTVFTLRGWPQGISVVANGRASEYSITMTTVEEVAYDRVVPRKIGRPFEQYRGRNSRARV